MVLVEVLPLLSVEVALVLVFSIVLPLESVDALDFADAFAELPLSLLALALDFDWAEELPELSLPELALEELLLFALSAALEKLLESDLEGEPDDFEEPDELDLLELELELDELDLEEPEEPVEDVEAVIVFILRKKFQMYGR